MTRSIGVAHLTLLSLTPPELVETAAAVGFSFVGIRVKAVTPTERAFDLAPGSPLLRETLSRLRDTGVTVRDIEFLPVTTHTGPGDWLPALEAGAALGASALTVTGADPDRARLVDTLSALTRDAADFGIRPLLEPISYQPVRTVADAAAVARATGAALMIDPLHVQRGGSPLSDIGALEADLVPVVQLCDAPADPPEAVDDDARITGLQREARVQRLLVGEGSLPLADLLAATPAGTPVSVEIPHERLRRRLDPRSYAAEVIRTARDLVERVDAAPTPALRPGSHTEGEVA
ncbi:MAG: TIM barrel protein [Microbacterium sp.]|uniref:TIM barrel protein n=1 Tax=Microbacterium sp. TaxID=51671 RepID=UPI001AD09B4E|nr:TIM barrel protein [Microbacterium sp.]MBN9178860.1 TIM barrel protein [Microbacterium sp.]